jgi:single-strand DNA-binding protein
MANLNLNKVILGGRLTSDPELKTTQSGISVVSFSIAVNRKAVKGEEQKADFLNCKAWRQTAEFISKYFRKGSAICIVGRLQTENWTDQNGQKHYKTEIVVDEAMFVDSKSEGGQASPAIPEYTSTMPAPNFEEVPNDSDLPF